MAINRIRGDRKYFYLRTDSYGGIVTIDNLNSSDWVSIFTGLDYNYYGKPNISLNLDMLSFYL